MGFMLGNPTGTSRSFWTFSSFSGAAPPDPPAPDPALEPLEAEDMSAFAFALATSKSELGLSLLAELSTDAPAPAPLPGPKLATPDHTIALGKAMNKRSNAMRVRPGVMNLRKRSNTDSARMLLSPSVSAFLGP
jgi:hypothetical protein